MNYIIGNPDSSLHVLVERHDVDLHRTVACCEPVVGWHFTSTGFLYMSGTITMMVAPLTVSGVQEFAEAHPHSDGDRHACDELRRWHERTQA